ncbi:alpha-1B adrenergic receptor-like [Rhopilema esculentum]|uniref:alpha-1B adrenergic receptor-like n=1 Tax=Rhopilema esculentum TaxID=499914 RepID=UPI0031CDE81C|eukprot:gene17467-9075_t
MPQESQNSTPPLKPYDPFIEQPIPTAVGLFTLAAIILTLNLVAIMVFIKKRKNKPPVDFPLLSLLIANVLQGTLTLPAYALKKINAFGDYEQAIICDIYRFSFFVCAHASIMSLLASNVDRLIALAYSLRYYEIVTTFRIKIILFATWMFVIAFDSVPLFSKKQNRACHYVPTKTWSVSMHIVMNIIPLPLLLVGYIITIRIAYQHARKLRRSLREKGVSRKEKVKAICRIRATKKVSLIIGSYFICVGPACVYYLLEWLCVSCFSIGYKLYREQYLHFFLKVLVNINAIISAIIFYWNSKDFRRSARDMLGGRDSTKNTMEYNASITADRHNLITNEGNCVAGSDRSAAKKSKDKSGSSSNGSLLSTENNDEKERSSLIIDGNQELQKNSPKSWFKRNLIKKFVEKKDTPGVLLEELN